MCVVICDCCLSVVGCLVLGALLLVVGCRCLLLMIIMLFGVYVGDCVFWLFVVVECGLSMLIGC